MIPTIKWYKIRKNSMEGFFLFLIGKGTELKKIQVKQHQPCSTRNYRQLFKKICKREWNWEKQPHHTCSSGNMPNWPDIDAISIDLTTSHIMEFSSGGLQCREVEHMKLTCRLDRQYCSDHLYMHAHNTVCSHTWSLHVVYNTICSGHI